MEVWGVSDAVKVTS